MNPQFFWYMARASGVVTFCLVTFSTALGLAISTRIKGGFFERPWFFELHKFAALLALGFLALHMAVIIPDPWTTFGPVDVLVPGAAPYRAFAVGAGVLAMYGAVAGTFSFYVRHLIGHRAWRAIHYTTFATYILILIHGTLAGTDSRQLWLTLIYVTGALLVFALTMYRILLSVDSPRAAAQVPAMAANSPSVARPEPLFETLDLRRSGPFA